MLERSVKGVRWLARHGRLPYEQTRSGQFLFREGIVRRVVEQRAANRINSRAQMLLAVRPRMVRVGVAPRQLELDFSARLTLVGSRGKGRKVA